MKRCAFLFIAALFLLGAVEIPQAWPQPNGDICYTYFASLSCVAHVTGAPLTPPAPTPTRPAETSTPIPPATATRTPATFTPAPALTLDNGGFESGLDGWTPYWTHSTHSNFNSETLTGGANPLAVHSGNGSARLWATNVCWRGGLYQTVHGAVIGAHYRVTAWYLTFGSSTTGLHNADVNMNSKIGIGIDPQGLTNPNASRVDWLIEHGGDLRPTIGGTWEPVWMSVTHDFIAQSTSFTIFVLADLGRVGDGACNWALNFTFGFFDDVTLSLVP